MSDSTLSKPMQPVTERLVALDALRGLALFGVLLVNLESDFRASLFEQMLTPHLHPGWVNYVTDLLLAGLFEFKAFTLFSLLFGVGIGVQIERAAQRQQSPARFLARRFGVLLVLGLGHMLFIWNGDILTLYAVCGLLLIPLIVLSAGWLAVLGLALIVFAPYMSFLWVFLPSQAAIRAHAALATQVYATGSFAEIMALRWHEAGRFIAPLLLGSLPRTLGLMLCGITLWRCGFLSKPAPQRGWLKLTFLLAGTLGASTTSVQLWAHETGQPAPSTLRWLYPYDVVLLAGAYGAGFWLWLAHTPSRSVRWLAAGGRLVLSNYLLQSVIFSLLFYGFGLGLFGKLGSAVTALLGLTVYTGQLLASVWWLQRYQFGPVEWLWRSLTYAHWQLWRRVAR
jgi:uncharacterized protein